MCFWNVYDSSKTLKSIQTVYFFNQRMRVKKKKQHGRCFFYQRNIYHMGYRKYGDYNYVFFNIVVPDHIQFMENYHKCITIESWYLLFNVFNVIYLMLHFSAKKWMLKLWRKTQKNGNGNYLI